MDVRLNVSHTEAKVFVISDPSTPGYSLDNPLPGYSLCIHIAGGGSVYVALTDDQVNQLAHSVRCAQSALANRKETVAPTK
jgi:hypothetical protein